MSYRLDQYLTLAGEGSRSQVKQFLKKGLVQVDGITEKQAKRKVLGNEQITLNGKPVYYEEHCYLMLHKPAGVVTHPQGGHYEDTLANQVSAYYAFRQESHTVRPIGRLDKDTSGIVLFAKNQTAAARLQKQRERGELQKNYLAVTEISVKWNDDTKKQEQGEISVRREPFREHKNQTGNLKNIERTPEHTGHAEEKHKKDVEEKNKVEKFPGWSEIIRRMEEYETTADPDGWTRIDTSMAPDPENRLRMIPTPLGKPARTLYKSLWTGKANQCFALHLETGRTHQIRLHMATLKCPLLGDPLYGGDQTQLHRAALHAYGVTLYQPYTGEKLHLTAPIPEDIRNLDLG